MPLRKTCKTTKAKKRPRTREYLEDALDRARDLLNPRDFAMIFQASRSSAGGKISARNRRERMSAVEKLYLQKESISSLSDKELKTATSRLESTIDRMDRQGRDSSRLKDAVKPFTREMGKRGIKKFVSVEQKAIHNQVLNALRNGSLVKPKACHTCKKKTESKNLSAHHTDYSKPLDVQFLCRPCHGAVHAVAKGFISGVPEGGMHAHGVDRVAGKTFLDGTHLHIWEMPGTGDIVMSMEDGPHEHNLDGAKTANDGAHSHMVFLPSGERIQTKLDGVHAHELMVETSGLGGLHTHMLAMPDGTEIESMTVEQFAAKNEGIKGEPGPCASVITNALNQLHFEREMREREHELELETALDSVAEGEQADLERTFTLEAVEDLGEQFVAAAEGGGTTFRLDKTVDTAQGDLVDVKISHLNAEVVGFSNATEPDDEADIRSHMGKCFEIQKHATPVGFSGPTAAPLLFLVGSPNLSEFARREALVGPDGEVFKSLYLDPLKLTKSEIATGFICPVLPKEGEKVTFDRWGKHLAKGLEQYPSAKIVAVGKSARDALNQAGFKFISLPYPAAIRKHGDSGEVARKLKGIAKFLSNRQDEAKQDREPSQVVPPVLADVISGNDAAEMQICISKSLDEKQIVTGIVLDPYIVDAHSDWIPVSEVESTAMNFMKKSQVIGLEHRKKANAVLVESFVESYPSDDDYRKALANEPHKATVRKFGSDFLHSGSWVVSIQLGDEEWADYKTGKLGAFSIGGFSTRTPISLEAMPKVDFIELS